MYVSSGRRRLMGIGRRGADGGERFKAVTERAGAALAMPSECVHRRDARRSRCRRGRGGVGGLAQPSAIASSLHYLPSAEHERNQERELVSARAGTQCIEPPSNPERFNTRSAVICVWVSFVARRTAPGRRRVPHRHPAPETGPDRHDRERATGFRCRASRRQSSAICGGRNLGTGLLVPPVTPLG